MMADAGICRYGEAVIQAHMAEFAQLDKLEVFNGVPTESLKKEQKRGVMPLINLIKEKRCDKIKGRTVADGRRQSLIYIKDEITSPTVLSDSLLMTLVIIVMEGRFVVTIDVPGAYLQTDMPDFVLVRVNGPSVDILCDINERYTQYMIKEKRKHVIHLKLNKSLYECLKSAMPCYDLFSKTLVNLGFKINGYDQCVANKIIDGNQCTITWYVDDLEASHKDKSAVMKVLQEIEDTIKGYLTIETGPMQSFLGIDITFTQQGTVEIRMEKYVQECIDTFGKYLSRGATTPAQMDIFIVSKDMVLLPDDRVDLFKHMVAKLLCISKRCRLDILLAVGFLCT